MSFERSAGPPAEPAPTPAPAASDEASDATTAVSPAMRLQILSTEHWSLLASRSLAWNESFSRGGMFLATLSGAIVALALVAQATDFGEGFRRFEPARDEPNHEHVICTVCGRVVEFRDERLDRMTMLIAEQHDFVRSRHKLVIEGVCGVCRGTRNEERGSAI